MHYPHDAHDRAALAGRVGPFDEDEHARTRGDNLWLQDDELDLQLIELELVQGFRYTLLRVLRWFRRHPTAQRVVNCRQRPRQTPSAPHVHCTP